MADALDATFFLTHPRLGANVQGVDGDVAAVADHLRHMFVLFLSRDAPRGKNKQIDDRHEERDLHSSGVYRALRTNDGRKQFNERARVSLPLYSQVEQ